MIIHIIHHIAPKDDLNCVPALHCVKVESLNRPGLSFIFIVCAAHFFENNFYYRLFRLSNRIIEDVSCYCLMFTHCQNLRNRLRERYFSLL